MWEIRKINPVDWSHLSEEAHRVVFNKEKPKSFDRIDYALLIVNECNIPCGYLTAREHDHESVYWQFGGAFPSIARGFRVWDAYLEFIEWEKAQGRKRITTAIENTNMPYLKMALKAGFRVIGVRHYNGTTLLECVLELQGG